YLAGALLADWTRRGVRPIADLANLLLDTLYVGVAVLVFDAAGPLAAQPLGSVSILALLAALASTGLVVSPITLNIATRLYHGRVVRPKIWRGLLLQMGSTVVNSCLGLVAVALILVQPLLAIALLPGIATVFLGERAAAEGRRRAQRMEFLYRTNDLLHSSLLMPDRYAELLDACVATFAMERAELVVVPESRDSAVRFFATSQHGRSSIASSPLTFAEQEMLNALRDHRVLSGTRDAETTPIGLLLAERNADAGTVALLRGHERMLGMILLLEPVSGSTQLQPQEQNMIATVASQVSVALENGQLSDAVRAMAAEKDELTRRAMHDPLTQLPNHGMFVQTVDAQLANLPRSLRYLAVAFIDLDDFKQINDTHGHAMGDQVLNCVATRLRQQVRKHDLAARLAGDEFALLLDGLRQPADARMVAERVVASLADPMPIDGLRLKVGGSVGLAIVTDQREAVTAEELLRRADMAMYLAKRQGKGRFVVFDVGAREPVLVADAPRTEVMQETLAAV
ncbi:MAG TPA: diguanylate cyclase, partial [Candidatus Dormibacteraeota bacterium]|nr:diguanylate cyclase [Candidatus Dormibacteraeota bacterium]